MQLLLKVILPIAYSFATVIICIFSGAPFAFGGYKYITVFKEAGEITYGLACAYALISAVAFCFILFVSLVQIALIEFHSNGETRDGVERKVWVRLLISGFLLLLPPSALEGIHLRLAAQEQSWAGFMNIGSLAYLVSFITVLFMISMWATFSREFRLQD